MKAYNETLKDTKEVTMLRQCDVSQMKVLFPFVNAIGSHVQKGNWPMCPEKGFQIEDYVTSVHNYTLATAASFQLEFNKRERVSFVLSCAPCI